MEISVNTLQTATGDPYGGMPLIHMALQGTNREMGLLLGKKAANLFGVRKETLSSADPVFTRASRVCFSSAFPTLLNRAGGVATAFGIRFRDENYDTSFLPLVAPERLPPPGRLAGVIYSSTRFRTFSGQEGKAGLLERKWSWSDIKPDLLEPGLGIPIILELHPKDGGFSSISLVAFDLLSGVLEGVNSAGLVVAVNPWVSQHPGEIIAMDKVNEWAGRPRVGLDEFQTARLLLDSCADVPAAVKILKRIRHYARLLPVRYLVADRKGRSFVFEYSYLNEKEKIIEWDGKDSSSGSLLSLKGEGDDWRNPGVSWNSVYSTGELPVMELFFMADRGRTADGVVKGKFRFPLYDDSGLKRKDD